MKVLCKMERVEPMVGIVFIISNNKRLLNKFKGLLFIQPYLSAQSPCTADAHAAAGSQVHFLALPRRLPSSHSALPGPLFFFHLFLKTPFSEASPVSLPSV